MAKEIGPKSFRVTDESRERFKNIVKAEGWENQDIGLNRLIDIYEIDQAKIVIGERRTEIEDMEMHLHAISEIYRSSLQLNQNAEARIKSVYEETLLSNQKTIQDLQGKIENLNMALETAKSYQEKNKELEKEIERTQAEMQKTEILCQEYRDKNDTLNGLLTDYKTDRDENIALHNKLKDMDQLQTDIANLKQQYQSDIKMMELGLKEEHQTETEQLKTKHHEELNELEGSLRTAETIVRETEKRLESELQKAELDAERKLLELDRLHQSELQKVKSENQREIDQYQKKYLELLERLQSKDEKKATTRKPRAQTKKPTNPEEKQSAEMNSDKV